MNVFKTNDDWTISEMNKLLSNERLYNNLQDILKNNVLEENMYDIITSICIAFINNVSPDVFFDDDE